MTLPDVLGTVGHRFVSLDLEAEQRRAVGGPAVDAAARTPVVCRALNTRTLHLIKLNF